jgi:hypothetical protein
LDGDEAIKTVHELLTKGLEWATTSTPDELPQTPEWSAIVESLAHLTPPQKGPISLVEVSGALVGRFRTTVSLTRSSSERIGNARKRLSLDRRARTFEGFVREFDKDKLTFILRTAAGETVRTVSFIEEQYGDVWLAFDTERPVTIVVEELPGIQVVDLVSITFMAGDDQPIENGKTTETGELT